MLLVKNYGKIYYGLMICVWRLALFIELYTRIVNGEFYKILIRDRNLGSNHQF